MQPTTKGKSEFARAWCKESCQKNGDKTSNKTKVCRRKKKGESEIIKSGQKIIGSRNLFPLRAFRIGGPEWRASCSVGLRREEGVRPFRSGATAEGARRPTDPSGSRCRARSRRSRDSSPSSCSHRPTSGGTACATRCRPASSARACRRPVRWPSRRP